MKYIPPHESLGLFSSSFSSSRLLPPAFRVYKHFVDQEATAQRDAGCHPPEAIACLLKRRFDLNFAKAASTLPLKLGPWLVSLCAPGVRMAFLRALELIRERLCRVSTPQSLAQGPIPRRCALGGCAWSRRFARSSCLSVRLLIGQTPGRRGVSL